MRKLALIPARYKSTRFEGKPLAMIGDKPMIMWVYDAVVQANLFDAVYVATDDERIAQEVAKRNGKYIMTSETCSTGTERCNQALNILEADGQSFDYVVNVQGDEPLVNITQLEDMLQALSQNNCDIITLYKVIKDEAEVENPNVVKVITKKDIPLYFSRSKIPYNRDEDLCDLVKQGIYKKHIGIYGFRAETLHYLADKSASNRIEKIENLEQLRWLLDTDCKFNIIEARGENIGVDTPEDLEKVKQIIKNR